MSLLRTGRPNMAVAQMLNQQGQAQGQAIIRSLKTCNDDNIDIHVQCSYVEIAWWMFINDLLFFTYSAAPKPGGHGPKTMQIIPSKYQWQKYKDQLHYYILLGVIPLSAVVLYANIYIGPATLCEIPEGYVPKQWEYYKVTTIQWHVKFPKHTVWHLQTNQMRFSY